MTPEIENLRADYEIKEGIALEARGVARDALIALNKAVVAWAKDDLAARGIEIGKTPVQVSTEQRPREWKPQGPFLVIGIDAYHGGPDYKIAKIKKDGTRSNASPGIWQSIVAVRPWGDK